MGFSCVYKTLRLQWLVLAFEEDLQGRLRTREQENKRTREQENKRTREQENKRTREQENKRTREQENKQDGGSYLVVVAFERS